MITSISIDESDWSRRSSKVLVVSRLGMCGRGVMGGLSPSKSFGGGEGGADDDDDDDEPCSRESRWSGDGEHVAEGVLMIESPEMNQASSPSPFSRSEVYLSPLTALSRLVAHSVSSFDTWSCEKHFSSSESSRLLARRAVSIMSMATFSVARGNGEFPFAGIERGDEFSTLPLAVDGSTESFLNSLAMEALRLSDCEPEERIAGE